MFLYYTWITVDSFRVFNVLYSYCRFTIDKIELEHAYLMSMNVSVCTESQQPCEQNYVVLNNVLLPILQCEWDTGFSITSKSTLA